MYRPATALCLIALLAACDNDNPFLPDDVVDPDPDPVVIPDPLDPDEELVLSGFVNNGTATATPETLANNLTDVSYTPGASTITVVGNPLDTTPVSGTYVRTPALDVPGYIGYSVQEDPLDRLYIAMVAQSAGGEVEGGVISDGGQFTEFFGSSFYRRNEAYTAPAAGSGLVSYAGNYVGLNNGDANPPVALLPVPPGTDPSVIPDEAPRVTGTVFINADFADMQLNGSIYDRQVIGSSTSPLNAGPQTDLFLLPTAITDDGTFVGLIRIIEDGTFKDVGTYGGAFGGAGASGVAGSIHITDYIQDVESEEEYGAFVLDRCATPGEGPLCGIVDP